jgi:hypothetical protein
MYVLKQNIRNLDKSYARIRQAKAQNKRISDGYNEIHQIFGENFSPLQDFSSVINQVFTMKNNVAQLNKTLKQFVNLGAEVNKLIDELSDTSKIIEIYNRLIILIRLRSTLISKFKHTDYISQDKTSIKLKDLEKELSGIQLLEEKFMEKIGGFMKKHQFIIQKQPAFFVKIMRIVEWDAKVEELTKGNLASITEEVEGQKEEVESTGNSLGLRKFSKDVLAETVKEQAIEAYKKAFSVDDIIDVSERLIKSLSNVSKELGHVFPPSYNIADIYFHAYKSIILEKVQPYVANMDKIIENDKGILLLLVAFVDSSEEVLEKQKIDDDSLFALKAQLSRFIPVFLEHIEHLLEDWLIGIRKQFYKEYDKLVSFRESNVGLERISEVSRLWTNMPDDIYTFMQKQFDLVSERLSGNHLFEVLKSSISRFTWLMDNLLEKAEKVWVTLINI